MRGVADGGMLPVMYGDHMIGWGWSMMVFWTILWVALLGVVVWAVAQWGRGGRLDTQGPLAPR